MELRGGLALLGTLPPELVWYPALPKGIGNEGLCCQEADGWVYREGGHGKVGLVGMGELPWRVACFGSLGAWGGCVCGVGLRRAEWGLVGAAAAYCACGCLKLEEK